MNREIKFRVWDKEGGTDGMISWDLIKKLEFSMGELLEEEKSIVMQFTGLYDMDGKEIYEGDIIGTEVGIKYKDYEVVEFKKGGFSPLCSDSDYEYAYESTHYKVLGNIYENPELVKK